MVKMVFLSPSYEWHTHLHKPWSEISFEDIDPIIFVSLSLGHQLVMCVRAIGNSQIDCS